MEITLSAYTIGLLASIVSEAFKLFPGLTSKEIYKAFTAIIVMVVGTLWSFNFNLAAWDWSVFSQVVIWAFLNYKIIVQPIAKDIALKSQP